MGREPLQNGPRASPMRTPLSSSNPAATAVADPKLVRRFRIFSSVASGFCVVVGAAVLVGWRLQLPWLTALAPGFIPMVPNTAAALILAGVSLALLRVEPPSPGRHRLGRALAWVVLLLGGLTLVEYLTGRSLGIDRLLVAAVDSPPEHPGRISLNAAANLVLCAMALLLIDWTTARHRRPSEFLLGLVIFNSFVAFAGYLYGAAPYYGVPGYIAYTGMALHTALALLTLSGGILCARPSHGLMRILSSRFAGGYVSRRLILVAAALPLLGFFTSLGERAGLYSPLLGLSLLVGAGVASAAALTMVTAAALDRADVARALATAQAHASREALRDLFEHASDGVFVADQEGTYLSVNSAGARMLGYANEEVVGRRIVDFIPPEEVSRLEEVRALVQQGATHIGDWDMRTRSGEHLPVEVSTRLLPDGRWLAFVRDVSERRRETERLSFLAQLGDALADTLDVQLTLERTGRLLVPTLADWCVIDLVDADGELRRQAVVHADPARRAVADELLRRTPTPVALRAGIGQALQSRKPVLLCDLDQRWVETHFPDRERAKLLLELGVRSSMILPLLARGHVLGTLSFVSAHRNYGEDDLTFAREIARRAAAFTDNARLYAEAQHAITTREDVLAVVSHDLRNPVSALRVGAEFIRDKLAPSLEGAPRTKASLERTLETMVRSSEHALRLITDLLDFAKLETGSLRIEPGCERVLDLLEETRDAMRSLGGADSVRVDLHAAQSLFVWADRTRLVQVLGNLVGNALKFNRPGGAVTLSARSAGDGFALFTVQDEGRGIRPEDLPHVFDRYWQSEETRQQGTGLGLAIVKGIVEAHGGSVAVESKPGRGSTFYVSIPLAREIGEAYPHAPS